MNIKRYEVRGGRLGLEEAGGPAKTDRQVVLLSDHIASHAYDEAKERELFTAFAMEHFLNVHKLENVDYFYTETRIAWAAWKACAKSRARSAE